MKDYELKMIQEIRAAGYTVEIATLEQDYNGIDCFINGQPVDIKAQTTNPDYDTVLLSILHSANTHFILPGYLRNSGIQIWMNDQDCFWVLEDASKILELATEFKYKSGATDKFGNEHVLAAIPKSKLKRVSKNKRRIVNG